MRREFVLNIIFLILANLIVKPGYTFVIETQIQNIIGPEEFGLYFSLFNLSYILQILLDLGIHNYGSQYLAKNKGDQQKYLSIAFTTKAILILLFAIVIIALSLMLGYDTRMRNILLLVSFNQICISAIFFYRSSMAALGHYRINSLISVMDKLIMIAIFVYALFINVSWRNNFDLYDFIYIRMAAYVMTTCISAALLLLIGKQVTQWTWDLPAIKQLIRKSTPFAIIVIFMGICYRTDAVMLERMLQDNGLQSGIYAAAYRIYHSMNTIGFLFSMLLLPMFADLLKSNRQELKRLALLSLETILFLTCSAVAIVYLLRRDIMDILYKSDASLYGTKILTLLALTLVLSSVIYIFGTLITANARLKELNILFVIATLFNIGLNWILIPKIGAEGAAWATFSTELIVVIGQAIIVYHVIPLKIACKRLLTIFLFIGLVISATLYVEQLNQHLIIRSLLLSITILVFSLATKVFNPPALIDIVKSPPPSRE